MYEPILTAEEAKQARSTLNLSQGRVAGQVDINRSYLSQFENGRYLLEDGVLLRLRSYYEGQGYDFSASTSKGAAEGAQHPDIIDDLGFDDKAVGSSIPERYRIREGFEVSDQIKESEAEVMLSEYADNRRRIRELCSNPLKRGLLFGIDEEDSEQQEREVLVLMARNYTLIERIHGHETLFPSRVSRKHIVQDCLSQRFFDLLRLPEE